MSEKSEIQLNLPGKWDKKEVVITSRTDDMERMLQPIPISIVGEISAPYKYIKNRMPDNERAIVQYSYLDGGYITLHTDPSSNFGHTVKGIMRMNREILSFGINSDKVYRMQELKRMIELNASMIDGALPHLKDLEDLDLSDFPGYTHGDVVAEFYFISPIFIGQGDERFEVHILLSSIGGGDVTFVLYSPELQALSDEIFKEAISSNIEKIEQLGYLAIETVNVNRDEKGV